MSVEEQLKQARHELKMAQAKNKTSLANNLCPDHRDKQAGQRCLACQLAESKRKNMELLELIGNSPDGTNHDWHPRAETWHAERLKNEQLISELRSKLAYHKTQSIDRGKLLTVRQHRIDKLNSQLRKSKKTKSTEALSQDTRHDVLQLMQTTSDKISNSSRWFLFDKLMKDDKKYQQAIKKINLYSWLDSTYDKEIHLTVRRELGYDEYDVKPAYKHAYTVMYTGSKYCVHIYEPRRPGRCWVALVMCMFADRWQSTDDFALVSEFEDVIRLARIYTAYKIMGETHDDK